MFPHKLAIATVSLGWHPSHKLDRKLEAAAAHGFAGVEMVHSDLVKFAEETNMPVITAASYIKSLCSRLNLVIVTLCPFENFEGHSSPLSSRLAVAQEWINIARALGTNIIQVPSAFAKDATGDLDTIVAEFRALAALGLRSAPVISFAYEAIAWGKNVALWEDSLEIVELVERANFGLCLDTYHVCARLWADPRAKSGMLPGGDAAIRATLKRFLSDCPVHKLFYVQLSDAEKLDPPLLPGHPAYDDEMDPTAQWCRYGRLFPMEAQLGGYFPIADITRAWLIDSGWVGWVSMEVFHRDMSNERVGPEVLAERGATSWRRLQTAVTSPSRL